MDQSEKNKQVINEMLFEINLWSIVSKEFSINDRLNKLSDESIKKTANQLLNDLIDKIVDYGKFAEFCLSIENFKRRENIQDVVSYLNSPNNKLKYKLIDQTVYPIQPIITVDTHHSEYYNYFLYYLLRQCKPADLPYLLNYHLSKYFYDKPEVFIWIIRKIRKEHPSLKYWLNEYSYKEIGKWLYRVTKDTSDIGMFFELSPEFNDNRATIIKVLFDDLTRYEFLEKGLDSYQSFQYVFGLYGEIRYHTINWIGQQSELKYFIQNLKKAKKITNHKIWLTCSHCILFHGDIIDDEQIRTYSFNDYLPKRVKLLDEIIEKIHN